MQLQLAQRQTQRLIMTPQMQQSIQLLQLNSLELEQMLEKEMLENPFLEKSEEGEVEAESLPSMEEPDVQESPEEASAESQAPDEPDSPDVDSPTAPVAAELPPDAPPLEEAPEKFDDVDINWEEVFEDGDAPSYSPPRSTDEEEHDFTTYTPIRVSLADHLTDQLRLCVLSGKDLEIADFLIGSLNEDGYLTESVERVAEELGVKPADVERTLHVLQEFDPPGVFARNLPECLLLQLEDQGRKTPLATRLLTQHFNELQKKKFREIAKALEVDERKIIDYFNIVKTLEPKPGRRYGAEQPRHIIPDVQVKEVDGEYIYMLNEGDAGRLRISKFYRDLLTDRAGPFKGEAREYAQDKYRSAVMLLKNIEKRKSTILRVAEAIMERQGEFLKHGVSHLKPMTLREIAEMVGMHEATISRVTSGKYVETPQGLYELKYFFSSGIRSKDGEATSSRAIKDLILDMIAEEEPNRPLSDEKIATILEKKGYQIARRTVAKYREQLKILPAKMRKQTK